ncbi:glycosyltransferase [Acidianus infernus]|uniref:Glycosyltransferase n=1 Tax=Acidianus infernus TaxID=12915 RepID=A0A6A9QK36_ACIIN|nr:glycosyltransferase [Acidianus infernus]MUM65670.1 glycosyltransferase [Acidianus infernus]
MRFDIEIYLITSTLVSAFTFIYITSIFLFSSLKKGKISLPLEVSENVTAVIPVYNEDVKLFRKVIQSVKREKIPFIVVGDGVTEPYKSIVEGEGGIFISIKKGGKRKAIKEGIKLVNTPYVLLLDSDTILPQGGIKRLISRLQGKVVAVSPEIRLIRGKSKLAYYSSEVVHFLRRISYKALSIFGSVLTLNGQCILAKTEVIKPFILSKEYDGVKLFRFSTILGDDRQLTNYVYKLGFKAEIVDDVIVKTKAPDSISAFFKQLIRWYRANNFFMIKEFFDGSIFKKGIFYSFSLVYWNSLPILIIISNLTFMEITLRHILSHPKLLDKILEDPIHAFYFIIVRRIENFMHLFYVDPSFIYRHIDPFYFEIFMLHNIFAELSSIASSIMLLVIFAHFRKNIKGFIMGLAAFPLMFFAELIAMFTMWKKKWEGRQ